MLHPKFLCAAWAALSLSGLATSQTQNAHHDTRPQQTADPREPSTDGAADSLPTDRNPVSGDILAPIHTAAPDPIGGDYGIWGAGPTYKASFQGGFRFIPYLGSGYPENREFGWRTASVTAGGTRLALAGRSKTWHDAKRFEYRHGAVTEAYDLRPDGVEQTFVFETRPESPGDLVVSGDVLTDLRADLLLDDHADLEFRDDRGNHILTYGAATAVDADGRRRPMPTSFDGRQLHLRVPGDWLASARFPVTIDPLLSRNCVAFWTFADPAPSEGVVRQIDIAELNGSSTSVIAYTRFTSSLDSDLWVVLANSNTGTHSNRTVVFTDLTTSWSNASPSVAASGLPFASSPDHWVVAFTRRFSAVFQTAARFQARAANDVAFSSSVSAIPLPSGSSHGRVMVGGETVRKGDRRAYLVYERRDPGQEPELFGRRLRLPSSAIETEYQIAAQPAGTRYTRARPSIIQASKGQTSPSAPSYGWAVAWQEYDNVTSVDNWYVRIRRISWDGVPVGRTEFIREPPTRTAHQLDPVITGRDESFDVAYTAWEEPSPTRTDSDLGTDIYVESFRWALDGSYEFLGSNELTQGFVSDRRWRLYDGVRQASPSQSGWTFESELSGTTYVATTGFDSGVLEQLAVYNPPGAPKAFGSKIDTSFPGYVLAYATNEAGAPCGNFGSTNHTVYTQRMTLPDGGTVSNYGTGCGPATIRFDGTLTAGSDDVQIQLRGATGFGFAALLLNLAPGNLPLDPLGMPGCTLLLDPNSIAPFPFVTDANGFAEFATALPSSPNVVCGDLYFQWAYLAPGFNQLGIGTTDGLMMRIFCP